jgi:tetratricopeptide (TPR) repeat protein
LTPWTAAAYAGGLLLRDLVRSHGPRRAGFLLFAVVLGASPARGVAVAAPRVPTAAECARAFDRGEFTEALALARRRLEAAPKDVATGIVLGRAEAALGRFEAAYDAFRQALRADPRHTDALYYLGITAGVLAGAEHERLFALAPGSARAHQLLAQSYQAQGRPHEAVAAYKAALEADPRSVELLVALGDVMRSQMQLEEAVGYYTRAAALAPKRYDVLYGLGVAHAFRREYGPAIERLRQALAVRPEAASARFNLARALLMSGQAAPAAAELEAVTAREPRMREAFYMLGRAYQALGRADDAARAFTHVRELAAQGVPAGEETPEADPR